MTRLIWWLRRDLRLNDNAALHYALTHAEYVIPVFIFDATLLNAERLRGARNAWLFDGLRALNADLARHGARLIVREGAPADVLLALCAEIGAAGVVFNRDYSPYAVERDSAVQKALHERGLLAQSCADLLIHEPHEVPSKSGKPYDVYSPFRRAWETLPKPEPYIITDALRAKLRLPNDLVNLPSAPIPTDAQPAPQPIGVPSEAEALRRLDAFLAAPIYRYHERRDLHGEDGTSALSPYLRFGMISVRTCYHAARKARAAASDEVGAQRRGCVDQRAGLARVQLSSAGALSTQRAPQSASCLRCCSVGRQSCASRRLARRSHRLSSGGRSDSSIAADGLDAQSDAHDRRVVPVQGLAVRLAARRALLHATFAGWRRGEQRRRLAMDGWHRH
jgi:hypothetical protein